MKENKKTLIAASIAVTAIVIISIAAFALTPSKNDRSGSSMSNGSHDMTSMTSGTDHPGTGDKPAGDTVDLTDQTTISIDIKDFKYSQQNIKVKKGTTVTWTNQDSVQHNVMKSHSDDGKAHDAPTKDEVKSDVLAGPLLAKGELYSFTFNEAGTIPYHCSPHPYMTGSVTVVE